MIAVLSILADGVERSLAIAREHGAAVDLVELRLDRLPPERIAELVRGLGRPCIAALRSLPGALPVEARPEEAFQRLQCAARAGADWVDLDVALAPCAARLPASCRPLVSRHVEGALPADPLRAIREVQSALPGAAAKVVFGLSRAEEGASIYRALERCEGEVTCFAMGAAGRATRLAAGAFGSRFCYLAPDAENATAAGQYTVAEWRQLCPRGGVHRGTSIFGVLGRPVGHSISPAVHRAAFDACGSDALYLAFEPSSAETFLERHDLSPFRGFSVTIPFKAAAAAAAAERAPAVEDSGAANTLVRCDRGWRAENTDGAGVLAALGAVHPSLATVRCLVLGTGGAARAALFALSRAGAELHVAGRDPVRCGELGEHFGACAVKWSERGAIHPQVLINATPLGMHPEVAATPFDERWIDAGSTVFDMVYRPRWTRLLSAARRRGARVVSGLEMFLAQAELQCELFGARPAPRAVMRSAALAALGHGADSSGWEERG